ncbi:conserved hypothetical protein [Trichinella spiralis]|uniref:hypothetical protein n=1 Tax=Trichinella spiralis TaxID=6334 RepID=UPI0001EFDF65|nr:conserved hypothetical protein [Trichinella spiralis]
MKAVCNDPETQLDLNFLAVLFVSGLRSLISQAERATFEASIILPDSCCCSDDNSSVAESFQSPTTTIHKASSADQRDKRYVTLFSRRSKSTDKACLMEPPRQGWTFAEPVICPCRRRFSAWRCIFGINFWTAYFRPKP